MRRRQFFFKLAQCQESQVIMGRKVFKATAERQATSLQCIKAVESFRNNETSLTECIELLLILLKGIFISFTTEKNEEGNRVKRDDEYESAFYSVLLNAVCGAYVPTYGTMFQTFIWKGLMNERKNILDKMERLAPQDEGVDTNQVELSNLEPHLEDMFLSHEQRMFDSVWVLNPNPLYNLDENETVSEWQRKYPLEISIVRHMATPIDGKFPTQEETAKHFGIGTQQNLSKIISAFKEKTGYKPYKKGKETKRRNHVGFWNAVEKPNASWYHPNGTRMTAEEIHAYQMRMNKSYSEFNSIE